MGLLGKPLSDKLQLFGDDLPVDVDIGSPVELDPHDRQANAGRRADPPYVAGAVHGRFDGKGDQRFDLFGRQTVRLGHDRDRGPVEVGEDVNRQLHRLSVAVDPQHDGHSQHEHAVSQTERDSMI